MTEITHTPHMPLDEHQPPDPSKVEPPEDEKETLSPERQEKAKAYAKIRRRLMFVDLGIGAAYVLIWILGGLSPLLRDAIHQYTTTFWLSVPLFAIGFGLPYSILTAPMSYYSGFVLPHRYGQSHQSLSSWLLDQAKGIALSG
ncbi:MAG: hypothetical protein AAF629_20295, partial [Chloroflexota bacterium]